MVTVEIKMVKLSDIKLNPDNPRTITKKAMDYLVKSLRDFPEMMQLREIVADETMTVLGGNMRILALRKAGVAKTMTKIVRGLTPEQKREFVIKDNSAFGEWDVDTLANSWSDLPLVEWGIDLPEDWLAPDAEPEEESEFYTLSFKFQKDDAAFIQEKLHGDREIHKEKLDEHWRERCLLRLLRKTD